MKQLVTIVVAIATTSGFAANLTNSFPPKLPIPALSAAEELTTFEMKPGYHLELVLSEPEIKEPVIVAFDGNGRMFVAEMRSYMQDIFPRGYKVELSLDNTAWGQPVATGQSALPVTGIAFAPTKARFIRITQTGTVANRYWSIHELGIYQPGANLKPTKSSKPAPKSYE